jgi:hypothetical protein
VARPTVVAKISDAILRAWVRNRSVFGAYATSWGYCH